MYKITKHPIISIPKEDSVEFSFGMHKIKGQKGSTIAAALHQAGFNIHSHSLKHRARSLECGIGKCGACEMLVDGKIKRICITKVDNIKKVEEIPSDYLPEANNNDTHNSTKIYHTKVAIIGAGPAGLAARETLNQHHIDNIVIDANDRIGGQFLMQTHQFFFFEKEKNLEECEGLILLIN